MKILRSPFIPAAAGAALLLLTACPKKKITYKNVGINSYYCSSGRMRLGSGLRNASGITFNPDTKTLFLIQDSPVWIHEVTPEGKIIRTIRVAHANDMEGICYIGNNQFALLEESSSSVYFCEISKDTTSLDLSNAESIKITKTDKNTGLEGIAFIPETKLFYAAKEKNPKIIFHFLRATGKVEVPWNLEKIDIKDVSDICWNPRSGNLLLLSHESHCIVEVTTDGKFVSRLELRKKRNGLKKDIEKPEGIAIDPETGTIYICGEKEEFYIFRDALKKGITPE